jgi:hypothetical protein
VESGLNSTFTAEESALNTAEESMDWACCCRKSLLSSGSLSPEATSAALRACLQYAEYKCRVGSFCNPCYGIQSIAHTFEGLPFGQEESVSKAGAWSSTAIVDTSFVAQLREAPFEFSNADEALLEQGKASAQIADAILLCLSVKVRA